MKTRERMLASGEIERLLPGVYRSAAWPLGTEQLKAAACLRNPAAALAFTTAGQHWGLRKMRDPRVHVLVPHGVSPELEGIRVHRCRRIDADDVVQLDGGIRVTSVARTLFDVGAIIGVRPLESALEHALDQKLVRMEQIIDVTRRLYHRRRPGSKQIRTVLGLRESWSEAVQSDLELRVLRALRRAGVPSPVVQHTIVVGPHTIRFDFAWPDLLVALEVDHSFWHAGRSESGSDKARDRRVAALGWTTLRLTEDDVFSGLDEAISQVVTVVRAAQVRLGR